MLDYTAIAKALVDGRLGLSPEQVELVRRQSVEQSLPLRDALLRQGTVQEDELLEKVAAITGTTLLQLSEKDVKPEAVQAVSASIVIHYQLMPISLIHSTLRIAVADPFREDLPEELSLLLDRPVDLVLATSKVVSRAIRQYYGVGAETVEQMVSDESVVQRDDQASANLDAQEVARDASVIRLVNQILKDAIEQRSTDVHFEPFEGELRVRYRIDGVLREAGVPSAAHHFRHAIVSRAKIMANLDVAERRLPQDGRAEVNLEGQVYDLRISILPTPHGEALNLRILPRSRMLDNLESLGFERKDLGSLQQLIQRPHGIILVTGPTGSGKTTTLYSVLRILNRPETKILTIEDPIEYRMRGVIQMQANGEIGFTFGRALRSILRHDPDVILIGEIRDCETAEITIRTALTGHLVLSTLHTNDAPTTMGRLIDMGIEPFLIASSVEAVLAQRLVRLICPKCKQWYEPEEGILELLSGRAREIRNLARGIGCRECRFTGYAGRTCITELMVMNVRLREMVAAKCHATDIRRQALRDGMQSLRHCGIGKLICGLTTVDEVLRVTPAADECTDVMVEEGRP